MIVLKKGIARNLFNDENRFWPSRFAEFGLFGDEH